jgi:hypothetical protein
MLTRGRSHPLCPELPMPRVGRAELLINSAPERRYGEMCLELPAATCTIAQDVEFATMDLEG